VNVQPFHVAAWSPTTPPASAAMTAARPGDRAPSAAIADHTAQSGSTTFQTSLSLPTLRTMNSGFTPIAIAPTTPPTGPARRAPMAKAGSTPTTPTTTGTQKALDVSG
jgi:hypothetical protein